MTEKEGCVSMRELVYGPLDLQDVIKRNYPQAVFTDASDYIHEERFGVEIENLTAEEFWKFALREGFGSVCLGFRMWTLDKPKECLEWVKKECLEVVKRSVR